MPVFETPNLFAKLPQEVIFNQNLTAGEVRLIAALMIFEFLDGNKKNEFGSYKIAEKLNTSPAAVRRLLKQLEEKKYIKITNQDLNGQKKSSKIELTINNGIYFALVGAQNKASERNQNDSTPRNQNDSTLRNQNDSILRNQNDSKKNQNDSTYKEERKKDIKEIKEKNHFDSTKEQIETGDGAPVRSMPKPDKSGDEKQESNGGAVQADIEDYCLYQAFFEDFKYDAYRFNLVQIDSYICFQPLRLYRNECDEIFKRAAAWFEARGRVLIFIDSNKFYQNQIIIKQNQ